MVGSGKCPSEQPRATIVGHHCVNAHDGFRKGLNPSYVPLRASPYRFLNFAGRFSTKAAMPSFWSSVANRAWNNRRSKRTPSASVGLEGAVDRFLGHHHRSAATSAAILLGSLHRLRHELGQRQRPARRGRTRSASAASIMRPVSTMSMALALPTARGQPLRAAGARHDAEVDLGLAEFGALSAAMMKSHIIASSQPPPSAKPATAAITGLRQRGDARPSSADEICRDRSADVGLVAHLLDVGAGGEGLFRPVMTMQPMSSSASNASSAAASSAISCGVQRIERLAAG